MEDGTARSPPRKVGRYVVEEELGTGGMGAVHRAFDPLLKRHVALKLLRPDPADDGRTKTDWNARMLREASMAAAFSHPNVVAIYDVGVDDGRPFIAMELVSGTMLRSAIGDERIPMSERVRWLATMARALGAAHRVGIVHRDVKPENVMITGEGVIKVLDFGIAKNARDADSGQPGSTLTAAGLVLGTPQYMAPEQIRGEPLDGRTDQFAWGMVAFELLTGRRVWPGSTQPMRIIVSILTSIVPSPQKVAPAVAPALSAVIDRTLSKAPADRFPDMDAVADAMEAAFDPMKSAVQRVSPHPVRKARARARRNHVAIVLVALGALAIGAGVVTLIAVSASHARQKLVTEPGGAAMDRKTIAVLPFENQTGRAEDNWLKTGLAEALRSKLARAYDVVSPNPALVDSATAAREGASVIILGSFQKIGDQIRIVARAQQAQEPGRVLATADEHGKMALIFDLQDAVAMTLTDNLRPSNDAGIGAVPPGSTLSAIRQSGTRNLEAFQAFSTGQSLLFTGHVPDAMRAFDRAVAADPEYRDALAVRNRVRAESHHFLVKDDGTVVETISEAVHGDPSVAWGLTTDSGTLTRAWDLDGNPLTVDRVSASGNGATFRVLVGSRDHDRPRGIVYELESSSKENRIDGLSVFFHSFAQNTSGENTFIVQLPRGGVPLSVIPTPAESREDETGAFLVLREARSAFVPYAFAVVHTSEAAVAERFGAESTVERAKWVILADRRMQHHGWAIDLARSADSWRTCLFARNGDLDRARPLLARIEGVSDAYGPFFVSRAEFCVASAAGDERAAAAAMESTWVAEDRPQALVAEAYLDAIDWCAARKRVDDLARLMRLEHRHAEWFTEKPFHTKLPAGSEESALRQVLEREPGNVAAAYDLALTLYQAKRYEDAATALQNADEFLGGVYVSELRARLAMARGRSDDAVTELRKLVTYYPILSAWTAHAVLLASAGRADEAFAFVAEQAPKTEYDPRVFWALRYVVGVLPHASRYADRIADMVNKAKETQYGQPYRLDRMIDLIEVASLSVDSEKGELSRALFDKFKVMIRETNPEACTEACLRRLAKHLCRVQGLTAAEREWIATSLGSCE